MAWISWSVNSNVAEMGRADSYSPDRWCSFCSHRGILLLVEQAVVQRRIESMQGMKDIGLARFVLPYEAGDSGVDIDRPRVENVPEANGSE